VDTTNQGIYDGLRELLSITDMALLHADNNNIAGVSICIAKRRQILEHCHRLYPLTEHKENGIRPFLLKLREKDLQLKQKLECHGIRVSQEYEKLKKKRGLRSQYDRKRKISPRFIDKKA